MIEDKIVRSIFICYQMLKFQINEDLEGDIRVDLFTNNQHTLQTNKGYTRL